VPAHAPSLAAAPLASWVGEEVTLHGLQKEVQYNGRRATVLKCSDMTGRLEVRLVDVRPQDPPTKRGLKMALLPGNLLRAN